MFLNNYRRNFEFPLVIQSVIKKYYYRRVFFVSKSVGNNIFFITNGFTDGQKITDERFTDGAFPSVISLVN
jgi:hypothetical protein